MEILSAPKERICAASSSDLMPPATQNGMSITSATRDTQLLSTTRTVAGGGDIVEHQLIRAFVGIAFCQRDDITDDFVITELHAFHYLVPSRTSRQGIIRFASIEWPPLR